ncbi:hypothetical protein EA462_09945 [Natrarchaeobius halalkaliphilus]|uniref:Type I restriction enzyme R protein N-terminal domain-containing protein n=1 Tax=Natrarchaeobius halalkaliphilus TaxID=1679091 RepID=A0A3N6M360_9EURY|nr:hypothetical protein [Natrarchaeobius halalkaliphilus]RQG90290.1 hypothetical protein EA462_09945 [Natrarchaeobius halalkaliphilus]
MTGTDLRPFVSRSRTLVDSEPPTTARETRRWLVEPFLESLGWDVHADTEAVDDTVEGVHLEYVLAVESIPALFVAVEAYEDSLEESRATALLEAMSWTGVDRAIYTNGRDYALLAGTTNVERLVCRLPSLTDHESSIEHFSRGAIDRRVDELGTAVVARRLALEHSTVLESIVEQLNGAAGGDTQHLEEFEAATDRFLDRLIVAFSDDEYDRLERECVEDGDGEDGGSNAKRQPPKQSDRDSKNQTDRDSKTDPGDVSLQFAESTASREFDDTPDDRSATADRSGGESPVDDGSASNEGSDRDRSEGRTGEYVVRFFGDGGSIGAIGHSSSEQALVHAAEYLFERGLSELTVPWSPADGQPTVLNDGPTRDDGSSMIAPRQLSNGLSIETGGNIEDHAERVRTLAARAGLRAMLTGDWESS